MTTEELEQQRRDHWSECALRAGTEAGALCRFVAELGFVTFAPNPELRLPALTLLSGGDEGAVAQLHRWLEADLAAGRLVEVRNWKAALVYVDAGFLPYLCASVGASPSQPSSRSAANRRQLSFLAAEVYDALLAAPGPSTVTALRAQLGAEGTSVLAVERALNALAPGFRAVHVGTIEGEPAWMPLVRLFPGLPRKVQALSALEAATALITRRLSAEILETEAGLGDFFIPVVPRHRLRSALIGLEAGRQVASDSLDGRPAYRLAPPQLPWPPAPPPR